jgi:hypothetical protein
MLGLIARESVTAALERAWAFAPSRREHLPQAAGSFAIAEHVDAVEAQ